MPLSILYQSIQKVSSSLAVSLSFPVHYKYIRHGADHVYSVGDNGTLTLWDYDTGTAFQNMDDIPQPGSLEAEAGVFCSTFDMTGTRLITGGADKTIKVCLSSSSSSAAYQCVAQVYAEQTQ